MKKTLIVALFIGLAASFPNHVLAIEFKGKITTVMMGSTYGNDVYIGVDRIAGELSGTRPCDDSTNYDFAFDSSTDAGKGYLGMILTAYTAQKEVKLQSEETCTYNVPRLKTVKLQ